MGVNNSEDFLFILKNLPQENFLFAIKVFLKYNSFITEQREIIINIKILFFSLDFFKINFIITCLCGTVV